MFLGRANLEKARGFEIEGSPEAGFRLSTIIILITKLSSEVNQADFDRALGVTFPAHLRTSIVAFRVRFSNASIEETPFG